MGIVISPGCLVGERFEIEGVIAAGSFATVHRARDRTSGRVIALKVMPARERAARQLAEEAEILAAFEPTGPSSVRHDGIVRLVEAGTTADEHSYLALEWVEGQTLSSRLAAGTLTLDATRGLLVALAKVLDEVHRHGIIHRDLKPSNVVLREGDPSRPVLIDFGLARAARTSTRMTSVVGTPSYMAPEQVWGDDVGPAADFFSLGCVAFECLMGAPPFMAVSTRPSTVTEVLARSLFEEAPRIDATRSDVPLVLVHAIARLLARSPDARIASARALEDCLLYTSRCV